MKNLCKKYGKRVKAFLLTMVMALSLVQMVAEPEAVKADVTVEVPDYMAEVQKPTKLYVGGKAVVISGYFDASALPENVEYDVDTATLTLKDGAVIEGNYEYRSTNNNKEAATIYSDAALNIKVEGNCTIVVNNKNAAAAGKLSGIYTQGKLSIEGGKLTFTKNEDRARAALSTFKELYMINTSLNLYLVNTHIECKDFTWLNNTNDNNKKYENLKVIYAYGWESYISNSKIDIVSDSNYGICSGVNNLYIIDNSVINIKNGYGDGISAMSDCNITILDSNVDCSAGPDRVSLNGNKFTIERSTIKAVDTEDGIIAQSSVDFEDVNIEIGCRGYGIKASGDVSIAGKENVVKIEATGRGSAIYLNDGRTLSIEDGEFDITGADYAIRGGLTMKSGNISVYCSGNNSAIVCKGDSKVTFDGSFEFLGAINPTSEYKNIPENEVTSWRAIKIGSLPMLEGIVAENVVGVAGEEVGITVKGAPEGATITYGTTAENCTESVSPKYKEAGEYTVYFEVKCEGYGTYKGSATITIKPYSFGGAIEDLGDDSITMEDNVVYFDVPEEDEENGFIYYQEMLPTAVFENKDALDAYINILTAGLNDGKVVDVPGTVNFEDVEANMLLAQNGTISVLNVEVDEFYNSAPVDKEYVVVLFKFHKENVIGKEFEEGETNIYFGEISREAYIYAVYGVHAEIVTPVFGPVINEPEDTDFEVEVGDEVNFEVDVEKEEGLEYQYQWWGKEYGDDEFKPIEGATNPTFTKEFDTCDKVYEYKCIVTNDNGSTESAVFTVTVEHKLNEVKANESTCTATGNNAYYKCECGACFTDADGENATTEAEQTTAKKPHDYADTWTNDGTNHWHKCKNCTDAKDVAPHVDVEGKDYVCDVCEYVLHTHKLVEVPGVPATCDKPGNNAYYKCTVDGCDKVFFKDAEGKNPTTEAAEVIPAKGHDYADTWTNDGVNHWHKCNNCTATKDVAPHADSDKDNVCDTCKYVLHTHKLVEVPGVPATCDKPGKNTYYKCEKEGCGAFFKDAEGKNPTTEAAEVIPAKGHADANKDEVCDACKADLHKHALTEVPATNATCEKAGNKEHYKCNCGKLFADVEGKTALTLTDVTIAPTAHADKDGDMVCDACKAELHKHVLVKVPGVAATCTTPGIKEHYKCTVENCTDLFVDAEGKTTITLEATKIAAHGHDWSGEWTVTKEATATEEGKKETLCERDCGQKKVVSIPKTGEADDNGNIEKDAEVEAEAPIKEATLNNSKPELIGAGNIFTKEDKEAIERGEDARVWIEITKTDETTIKDEDKAKMEEEAADLVGEDATLTYFDVDLFKQVGNGEKEDIAKPGVAIKITIAIPEELLNHDATLEREYKIIRLHTEGDVSEVDVIEGEFNAETGEFSFETDRFSTYAIAYSDTSVEVDVPNTGENVFVTYTYVLLLISGLGLFFRARKAK